MATRSGTMLLLRPAAEKGPGSQPVALTLHGSESDAVTISHNSAMTVATLESCRLYNIAHNRRNTASWDEARMTPQRWSVLLRPRRVSRDYKGYSSSKQQSTLYEDHRGASYMYGRNVTCRVASVLFTVCSLVFGISAQDHETGTGLIPRSWTPPRFRLKAALHRPCARLLALAGWKIYVGLIFPTTASTWRASIGVRAILWPGFVKDNPRHRLAR